MEFKLSETAKCIYTTINSESAVCTIKNASAEDYASVTHVLIQNGYELKEENSKAFHKFGAYLKAKTGVFVNYFVNINEITVCTERETNYFSYCDEMERPLLSSQITQVHLKDFGMSYVIRLCDGRFIIIDGGWDYSEDAERLYEALRSGFGSGEIVIAAWIFSHMDCDHYRCINAFTELHRRDVTVQKFMFNFPARSKENFAAEEPHILKAIENMKLYGAEIYRPHTGQRYRIGNALFECLSCPDDTYYFTEDDNAASLVFRMELEGQVVLWTGDAVFSDSALLHKYGNYLKADILQVPHHGFFSGDQEEQKKCYDLIAPEVCFLPLSDYDAYVLIATYIGVSEYLMTELAIKQLITGDETVTITLPYHAPEGAGKAYRDKFEKGRSAAGKTVWIYSGLCALNEDDYVFDVLNTAWAGITVSVDVFFEDANDVIVRKSFSVPQFSIRRINILDIIKENRSPPALSSSMAIRFLSKTGIVITHKKHIVSYSR